MPNMSYCRFENTARDLRDCIDALNEIDDPDTKPVSASEHKHGAGCSRASREVSQFGLAVF